MIVSHRHRFIFIKTEKTAGTSIELALSQLCGPEDVITPVVPADEALRAKLGARGPQNCLIPFRAYRPKDWARFLLKRTRARYFNHASAAFVREHVGSCWESYFKFSFDRNPWDKAVSWYYWRNGRQPELTLSEFIQSGGADRIRGFDLYSIDGEIAVDRVCRYEHLEEELENVARIIGLPDLPPLPRSKAGIRADGRSYRESLSPQDRDRIARVSAREIATMGYAW